MNDGPNTARAASGEASRPGMVAFAKLFPNPAEPFRGSFVADQLSATADAVDWAVVAPVPWVPKAAARAFGKPYVRGDRIHDGVHVYHPRYPVLPRRIAYATVAPAIALTARRSFERACAGVSARLVHAHDLYPSGAAARRLCEAAGLPYVLTVHGSDLYSNLANPRWRSEVRHAAAGARAVVCVGTRLAHDCVAEIGCDPARTVVIPDTYDARRFRFVRRDPGARAMPHLVSLGRLSAEKGHDVLLRSMAELEKRRVRVTLEIVGDGPERETLERLRLELGLEHSVRFAGRLLDDDVAAAYADADAFVLPSRAEGFGVALVEALATGLPVLATRSGGPEDIVQAGDGELVEPDDAVALADGIVRLVGDLETYDTQRIAARAAERFSPRRIGDRLVRLYGEVLSERPLTDRLGGGS